MSILATLKDTLLRERTLGRGPAPSRARRPASGTSSRQGDSVPSDRNRSVPLGRQRNRQRGVALVAVMIAIAVTLVISNEFGTSTNVDLMAAANYRDQMRSHFLARSAISLSELVIRVQQRIDNVQQLRDAGIRITDFADQVLLAFCGNPEEVQAAIGLTSSDAKGLGADVGTCGILGQITTDDDKLNLNCANGSVYNKETLAGAIASLIYFPAYDPVFEEADAEGYRRDRATQASALVDYVDQDITRGSQRGVSEDYGYETLKDPYKPKNSYLDTLGEMRLIRGVDDRFWTLFGSAFTVYGACKVNVTTLTNTQLIAGMLLLTAKNPNDPVVLDPNKLFALASLVAQAKTFGVTFPKLTDFVDFVKDPEAQIGILATKSGTLAGSAASKAVSSGLGAITGGQKLGLVLDFEKINALAAVAPRRTYRVEAWGEIERKQKMADGTPVFPAIRSTITGVWDTKVVPQNVRKPPVPKGAWVFLRED